MTPAPPQRVPDAPAPAKVQRTIHDEVAYPSNVQSEAHIERLAVIGRLFGVHPAPVSSCRVLELGCGAAGHLLPMACQYPDALFLGIDAAETQIRRAAETASRLGLTNVELVAADIATVPDDWLGEFDYIIAHGLYSWVPPLVQERVLSMVARHLAPNGMAYVSFNALPGWKYTGVVREAMLLRASRIDDPLEKVAEGTKLIKAMAAHALGVDATTPHGRKLGAYSQMLQSVGEHLDEHAAESIFHDELCEYNEALYFTEFMSRASQVGLQFIAEANVCESTMVDLTPEARDAVRSLARSMLDVEQLMDFLKNRSFRRAVLCRDTLELPRRLAPDALAGMYVSADIKALPRQGTEGQRFVSASGGEFETADPFLCEVLRILIDIFPEATTPEVLTESARAAVGDRGTSPEEDLASVLETVLRLYGVSIDLMSLRTTPVPCTRSLSDRPTASSYARLQAASGVREVVNQRHERVLMDEVAGALLPFLDGTRDRAALIEALTLMLGPAAAEDPEADRVPPVGDLVDLHLRGYARWGLLTA